MMQKGAMKLQYISTDEQMKTFSPNLYRREVKLLSETSLA
jgi:hypothetical protein